MRCEAGRCKTSTPSDIFIVTPSLDGLPTKAKDAPSPQEVRLALLENPVFKFLRECACYLLFGSQSVLLSLT